MRPDVLAEHVATTIRQLHHPLALQVAALESHTAGAIAAVESVIEDVRERIGRLETRAPVPGPPGPAGPEGPAGPAGRDGLDGKSLNYLGVHVVGKTYDAGDLVTDHGSLFYCSRTTTGRPAASPDWKLMVKRGQDGKDSR